MITNGEDNPEISATIRPERDERTISSRRSVVFWAILLGLVALFSAWRINHVGDFGWSYDEGVYMMSGRLLNAGYRLYIDIFSVTSPLFITSIALALRMLGTSVAAARTVILLCSLIALLVVGLMAREVGGRVAGVSAVALLAAAPGFYSYSTICVGDVPAISLALVAVLCALYYRGSGRRAWLIVSGLAASASLLMKVLVPFALLLAGLIAASRSIEPRVPKEKRMRRGKWGRIGADLALLVASFLWPLLLCAGVYGGRTLYEQVLAFRWDARAAYPLDLRANGRELGRYLAIHWGLALLALYGGLSAMVKKNLEVRARNLVFLEKHQRLTDFRSLQDFGSLGRGHVFLEKHQRVWPILAWLALSIFTVMGHTPLWPRHLTILLPPLAVLAGLAVSDVLASFRFLRRRAVSRRWALPLMGLGVTLLYLFWLPTTIKVDNRFSVVLGGGREREAINFLQEVTTSDDFIVSDDQMLVFMADRNTLPALSDSSLVLIKSGHLTAEHLITLAEEHDPQVVVFWGSRFAWLPPFPEWVREHYLVARVYDDQHQIYYVPKVDSPAKIEHPLQACLGSQVRLLGYEIKASSVKAGEEAGLTLYWQGLTEMDEDYTVFVHLVGEDGRIRGQQDSQPLKGLLPTSAWPVGEIIPDRYEVKISEDVPAGCYQIVVGMYLLVTMERLPFVDETGRPVGDSLKLAEITVE